MFDEYVKMIDGLKDNGKGLVCVCGVLNFLVGLIMFVGLYM